MKKVKLIFHSGQVINEAYLLCQSLLTLIVIICDKTYLVSKDALSNFVIEGEESISKNENVTV